MSRITDVLLLVSHAPPGALAPFLERIRVWEYREIKAFPLVSFVDERLPEHWYGGDAELGAAIAIGALNHLPLEGYLAMLRSLPWQELGHTVQLAVNGEEEFEFRLHPIFPLELAEPDAGRAQALTGIARALPVPPPDGFPLWPPEPSDAELAALDDAIGRYLESRGYQVTRPEP